MLLQLFIKYIKKMYLIKSMVEMTGIEPATLYVQGRCSPNWATPPILYNSSSRWWAWEDLNFRPLPYQSSALTNWATSPFHYMILYSF